MCSILPVRDLIDSLALGFAEMECFYLTEYEAAFEKAAGTEKDYFDTPSLDPQNWTEINWSKYSCQGCFANCHQ